MSIQRNINPLDATPIKSDAAFTRFALDDRPKSDFGKADHHEFSAAVLSVLRFIAAAYATGEAECWEAAFRFADDAAGEDGALLVARVAALVRLIRRHHGLICLPPSCSGLSIDERRIMTLIGLGGDNDHPNLVTDASAVGGFYQRDETLVAAATSLIELARVAGARHPQCEATTAVDREDS
ncbi:hypothetical protein [Bradyrhizobium cenepequi]